MRQSLKQNIGVRQILLSVKNTFSDAYYMFFNPPNSTATEQSLTVPLQADVLPFSNLGNPLINSLALYFVLEQAPPPETQIAATFGPTGGAGIPISIAQVQAAQTTSTSPPIPWIGADSKLTSPTLPGSLASSCQKRVCRQH